MKMESVKKMVNTTLENTVFSNDSEKQKQGMTELTGTKTGKHNATVVDHKERSVTFTDIGNDYKGTINSDVNFKSTTSSANYR